MPTGRLGGKIDRGGIEGVDGPLELDVQGLAGIQPTSLGDQHLRQLGVDPPIAPVVGIGQGAAGDGSGAKSQVIELFRHRAETRFDVAQTLAIGKLGEGHAEDLVPAGELFHPLVADVAPDQPPKSVPRQMVHELNEHGVSLVH